MQTGENCRGMSLVFEITALFAGIGGFELGLARSGHEATLFCESDFEASQVLAARFPRAMIVPDVRRLDEVMASISPTSNLLTAGFPCSDLSQAGRMEGFSGKQSGLIRTTLELLKHRPFPHVLLENVPNWRHLHDGRYLREVIEQLERLGFLWAYRTIDSRAFGLPQRRERIFLYATRDCDPRSVLFAGDETPSAQKFDLGERAHGFYWTEGNTGLGWAEDCIPTLKGGSSLAIPSPPAILLTDGRIVTPHINDAERFQGFPAKWTDVENPRAAYGARRFNDRRRWFLVGNAITVDISTWIGAQLANPKPYAGECGQLLSPSAPWPNAAWGNGTYRWKVRASTWPVARAATPLADFLRYPPTMLSYRATVGFLSRISASSLKLPPGFQEAVKQHVDAMAAVNGNGHSSTVETQATRRITARRTHGSAVITDSVTSARMKRIRQRSTDIEVIVRRYLAALGVRFRIRNRDLPGSPDIANRSRKWAVFVHGCFWHGHPGCPCARLPKRNHTFWAEKIHTNLRRDDRKAQQLRDLGYDVITVWGCEAVQLTGPDASPGADVVGQLRRLLS